MTTVPLISIASCSACQNSCENCAHHGIRESDLGYQMELADVQALLDRCRALDVRVANMSLCGPGEPLLWKHFNDAVRLLMSSGLVGKVETTTNGLRLNVIADDVWEMLSPCYISGYGYGLDYELIGKHAKNVVVMARPTFWKVDESRLPVSQRGACGCPGATYYKGRIYPHCGPVMWDACDRAKLNAESFGIPLGEWNPMKVRTAQPPCEWCWGNPSTPKIVGSYRQVRKQETVR